MVVNALQQGLLYLPELFYVRIGQITEELKPESKQLTLVRIVEPTTPFAGISLVGMIHRQGLILDVAYGAHLTVAFIKDLEKLVNRVLHDSGSAYLGSSGLGVIHPLLPLASQLGIR
jgi:hypothetical protein